MGELAVVFYFRFWILDLSSLSLCSKRLGAAAPVMVFVWWIGLRVGLPDWT